MFPPEMRVLKFSKPTFCEQQSATAKCVN